MPATPPLIRCDVCRVNVRQDRLQRHRERVHGFQLALRVGSSATPNHAQTKKVAGDTATEKFLTRPCSCGGSNENCYRCGGWGYIDSIGTGRRTEPFIANDNAVSAKTSTNRKKSKLSGNSKNAYFVSKARCPVCGLFVADLPTHRKKIHSNAASKRINNSDVKRPLDNTSSKSVDREFVRRTEDDKERITERKLDATSLYYASFRDHGQFGSHPSHDDYGEESDI